MKPSDLLCESYLSMGNRRNQSKLPLLDIVTYKLLSMQTFNLASCFGKSFILVCGSSLEITH